MLESREKLLEDLFVEGDGSGEGQGQMDLHATTQGLADEASSEGHEFHSDHTHSGEPDPAESPEGAEFHADGFHADEGGIAEAPPMTVEKKAGAGMVIGKDDLRRSIIMAEVLGRPVSLRGRR